MQALRRLNRPFARCILPIYARKASPSAIARTMQQEKGKANKAGGKKRTREDLAPVKVISECSADAGLEHYLSNMQVS